MYIQVKELPNTLINALKAIGYNKPDIKIEVVKDIDLFCSGSQGRRSFATILNLDTGETKQHTGSWGGSNMFNPNNRVDLDTRAYPIPLNGAVIKGSEGYGGTWATVYVSASNLVQALDAPKVELSDNEKGVLKCLRSIKSSYRKEYLFGSYSRDYFKAPLTQAEYRAIIDRLAQQGFVKVTKAGAVTVTTLGKNVGR